MQKLTLDQVARKTTWSDEDEHELFSAIKRAKSDSRREDILMTRAKTIAPAHPEAAAALIETVLRDYAKNNSSALFRATSALADVQAQTGKTDEAATMLRDFARQSLDHDSENLSPLIAYMRFVAVHDCDGEYQSVLDMVPDASHLDPRATLSFRHHDSFRVFSGAAYIGHLVSNAELEGRYLEDARTD